VSRCRLIPLAVPNGSASVLSVKALVCGVLLAGCGFQSASSPATIDGNDGKVVDAGIDPVIPIDGQMCFGAGLVKNLCVTTLPTTALTLPGAADPLDTDVDANCTQVVTQAGGSALCVIIGTRVTVNGSLVAIGLRPLVVLGTDEVSVSSGGTLDASSKQSPARKGAGANPNGCTAAGSGKNDSGGAGGGAGGSFGTAGGAGGDGDRNTNGLPVGSAAGGAAGRAPPSPTTVRGGCAGGAGGAGDNNDGTRTPGAAGDGGGAIYVIAGRTLNVTGNIYASGAGGGSTSDSLGIEQGGGGGGAGGMIGLDAPTITVTGRLVANGGGGAGGGGTSSGGGIGGDGTTTAWNTRASGGARAQARVGSGAEGTTNGVTNNLDGEPGDGGGGGGAGGLGFVMIYGRLTQAGAQISPAAITQDVGQLSPRP
jgi:hypothetical protein